MATLANRSPWLHSHMRAVTQTDYGNPEGVLVVQEMPVPVPRPGQVMVRVIGASGQADVIQNTAHGGFFRRCAAGAFLHPFPYSVNDAFAVGALPEF